MRSMVEGFGAGPSVSRCAAATSPSKLEED